MNLYRSFGNLMEAWVTEGAQSLDSEWLGINDEDGASPSSNLRSESVDSGVETASSETSFPSTSRSLSMDIAETDASTSQSPVLSSPGLSSSSSPSPHLHASRVQDTFPEQLEQTSQKTDSKCLKTSSGLLTVEEVLRRRPKRHTSELVRGQRSESFGPKRTVNPSAPTRQMSDVCKRPVSMNYDTRQAQTRSEDVGDEKKTELSPGLCYLEQVCQMLEEIARQQMQSRALQTEMEALQEHEDIEESQALDTCQRDSKAAEEEILCNQRVEKTNSLRPQQRKDNPYRHFRQRSASDTNIALLHFRMLNTDCRGQHLCTDSLEEEGEEEEVHKKQESKKEQSNVTHKNWKLKIGSLRREESAVRDTRGQQMQPSERISARRRLSQLFRRGRKTLPA
ncbi:uncharacterized protein si:dkey-106l3.7 isoform X1 [Xyrichtys novacula]|uniref:Uncharacterized protein si:dkey-106l3.7 isoform X1 n=1 Tax=Xyrichtys novacula TaxID=13765 RepID=A0AAV1GBI7_XYRNO|nr:uncharacterized protein si:dkey-106l3.7 isoform X1 [Xyrichtys novacula]